MKSMTSLCGGLKTSLKTQTYTSRLTWTRVRVNCIHLHAYFACGQSKMGGLRDKVFRALGLASAWNDKAGPILADCTGTITHLYIDVLEQAMPLYASSNDIR